jgi:hypothetical protein
LTQRVHEPWKAREKRRRYRTGKRELDVQRWFTIGAARGELSCLPAGEFDRLIRDGSLRTQVQRTPNGENKRILVARGDVEAILLAMPLPPVPYRQRGGNSGHYPGAIIE